MIPHAPRPAYDMEDELGERDRDRDRDRDRERDPGALPAALGVPPAASAAAKRQSPRVRQLLLYRKSLLSVLDENRKTFQGRAYWAACSAAAPSTHASTTTDPARPHRRAAAPLCVMCSYWGDATCTLCGDAICGLDCLRRCVPFCAPETVLTYLTDIKIRTVKECADGTHLLPTVYLL